MELPPIIQNVIINVGVRSEMFKKTTIFNFYSFDLLTKNKKKPNE